MEKKQPKWILEDERGKRPGQKFKSLLVMQYILKYAAQFASTDCPFRMSGVGSSVEAVWVLG